MNRSNSDGLLREIKSLIVCLRRQKDLDIHWPRFTILVHDNLDQICTTCDTRWLVSITDTFANYGTPIERRNAMFVSIVANFEKLWATNLLMYDVHFNQAKLKRLKKNRIIPLWDGMYSFNINRGDMTNNLFGRVYSLLEDTPVIRKIFDTVLERIKSNDTTLANLELYHTRLFEAPRKRSFTRSVMRNIRSFFRNNTLFVF